MLRHTEGTNAAGRATDQQRHASEVQAFQVGHAGSIPVTRSALDSRRGLDRLSRPEPWATPRRAMHGVIPRARGYRRNVLGS